MLGAEPKKDQAEDGKEDQNRLLFGPERVSESERFEKLNRLNEEQRTFIMHVFHSIKTEPNLPLRIFLSGSAGAGKTTLIDAIYQLITNHYNTLPGTDQESTKVLLTAFTGKAAVNISGMTIHSAFKLNTKFNKNISRHLLKRLQYEFKDVKLLIIDEISTVGCKLLDQINFRLKRIKESEENFGGVSVIVAGDLLQLPPVLAKSVFLHKEKKGVIR